MLSRKPGIRLLLAGIVVVTCFLTTILMPGRVDTQARSAYFPQTKHTVQSPFYEFFMQHGGVRIFGYPITEQIVTDSTTGYTVQYFQRSRLEYAPREVGAKVTVAKLVAEMGWARQPLTPEQVPPDTPYQRYFPATGHTSSYAFLAFYDNFGGEPIFGYPISEPAPENGRLVQYFERAVMEWWPEKVSNDRVQLAAVGQSYALRYLDPSALAGVIVHTGRSDEPTPAPAVTDMRAVASVKEPIMRESGNQTVYVLVTDQSGNPVEGARVSLTVNSNLSVHYYTDVPTSKSGIAAIEFTIEPDRPGTTVTVDVKAKYAEADAVTQTSYLVWWGTSQ